MFPDVLFVFDELVPHGLLGIGGTRTELREAVNHVAKQMKPVQVVQYRHVEGRSGGAFFFETAHMQVRVVAATIGQTMNEQWITVEGEDDRLILGKE